MPYNPMIAPPPQLWLLDPAWANCYVNPVYEGWDPPQALQPQAVLAVTTDDPAAGPTAIPQGPSKGPSLPTKTSAPVVFSPKSEPALRPESTQGQVVSLKPTQTQEAATEGIGHAGGLDRSTRVGNFPQDPNVNLDPSISHVPSITALLPSANLAPSIVLGDRTIRSSDGKLIIGTQTVPPGASVITIDNTPISIDANAGNLIIGSSTIPLPQNNPAVTSFVVAGLTLTASNGVLSIGSQTLSLNSPAITVVGTALSLGSSPDGSLTSLIVGSQTFAVPQLTPDPGNVAIIAGVTLAATVSGFVVDGSTTLVPGQFANIDGMLVSIASNGGEVVVASSVISVATSGDLEPGLGSLIWLGLGGSLPPETQATPTAATLFTGAVSPAARWDWMLVGLVWLSTISSAMS